MQKLTVTRNFVSFSPFCDFTRARVRRHQRILAAAALIVTGFGVGRVSANTVTATWTDAASTSLWSNAGNWSPTGVPNNGTNSVSDYNVVIGAPSPTVLDISPTIDSLTISSGGILDIQYNSVLTVNGPVLTDNGSIVINSNQGAAPAYVAFGANTALNGSGTITLQEPGSNAQLYALAGITVTQAATHTIAGYGQLNLGFTNNGIVNANVSGQGLTLGTDNMTNNLTFEATNGGTLGISGITLTQGASGTITAATGSAVSLSNAVVTGGKITTAGTGSIQIGGTSTIGSLTNSGLIDVPYNQVLNVAGNLVNNGSIVVNSNQAAAVAALSFNGGTLSGNGSITLQEANTYAQINGSLTQSAGHTIQGYGQVNATVTNNGTINANFGGQSLTLTAAVTNNSLLESTIGGSLNISSAAVTQGAGGQILAGANSSVVLTNGTVNGGALNSANPGGYVLIQGTSILNGVTNGATIDIPYSQTLNITGNLVDNGTIVVNSNQAGGVAAMNFSGGTVSGTGTIVLQQPGVYAQLNGAFTQASGHTITGYGEINGAFTNHGVVNANVAATVLYIESPTVTNTNLLEATLGTLYFDSATAVNNTGGTIATNGGAITLANGAAITGGTLSATAPSVVTVSVFNSTAGYSAQLNSVTVNTGTEIDLPYSNTFSIVGTTFTNNGVIVVNSTQGGAVAKLAFNSSTLLTGNGNIRLQQPGGNALLTTGTGDIVTQDIHHSIGGYGEISAALVNNNIVNANISSQILYLDTNNMTNNLTFEATNGGTLAINGITVTQGVNGQISAATNSAVSLSGSTIVNGVLSSVGTGSFQIVGTDTLASLTNNATIDLPYNQVLNVTGNLVNSGSIVVNSNTGGAVAALNFSGGTISGTGSIILQQGGNNAQLNGSLIESAGQTIQGYGQINATVTNNGTINSNVGGQTLTLAAAMTNNTIVEATNGGFIVVAGATITQPSGGQILAAINSAITLTNATINGGTLISAANTAIPPAANNAGYFYIQGTTTLNGITNGALIDLPYNQAINVTGNLVDNGSIIVNSNTGGAVAAINFNGGVLSGTGSIFLQQGGNNAQINGTLTQSAGHTIQGYGQINAVMTNNGTINSNVTGQTLTIAGAMTNNSLIEVINNAALTIAGVTVTQGAVGQITEAAGSTIALSNATISGGFITGPGVATVSGTSTLNNVTNSTNINIPYNQALDITGNLTDNGSIVVNSNQGGAVAQLNFSGGTVSGNGTITLQQPGSNAQLNGPLTQAAGHTIAGYGQIAQTTGTFINNGLVNANVSGQTLFVNNAITNGGTLQASNGGILTIATGVLTNLSGTTLTGGTYEVDANSTINLPGSIVTNGGTVILSGVNTTFAALTPLATNTNTLVIMPAASFSTVAGLSNSGTITTFAPVGVVPAGTLTVNGTFNQSAGQTFDNGLLSVTGATTINGGTVTVGPVGSFTGTPITVGPAGHLIANGTLAGSPTVTDNGSVIFGANPGTGILTRTLTSLSIGSTGSAVVNKATPHTNRTLLVTSSLTIASTGLLDLTNNDLDVHSGSLSTITAEIKQGYNSGNFLGSGGITSSAAAADPKHLTTLGVILNGTSYGTTGALGLFDGSNPASTDVLVKYTYYGDANLDGRVDGSDYTLIDNGFNQHGTLTGWSNGDFNYDGKIDGSDYTLIDNAFNTQGGNLNTTAAGLIAANTAQIASSAAVPEPTMLGVLGLIGVGSLRRVRSRRSL